MKKLLDILRLHYDSKLSQRQISKAINISKGTVVNYLQLFKKSELSWPLAPEYQNEAALSKLLNPNHTAKIVKSEMDFAEIAKELRQNKKVFVVMIKN